VRVHWTTPASRDLLEISDYIAQDSPAAAHRVAKEVRRQVGQLAEHPHIGRPGRVPDTRELVITSTPYIAPYRVAGEVVEILAVLHGARRWPGEFG
jgi:toxin ParE1/3/4